jgi:ribonuclease Z
MEILFLGTSSGTPTKARNVSGVALRLLASRQWHLVDCGEGTQHQILHTNLSLMQLGAIFITHIHGDHCYGLPGLLASAGMLNRAEPLYLIGPTPIRDFVQGVLDATQLQLPYPVEFIAVEDIAALSLPDFQVQATPLSHRVPSYAYSFAEKNVDAKLDTGKLDKEGIPRGPDWGHLQQGKNIDLPDGRSICASNYLLPSRKPRKIVIAGDNDTPGLLAEEARTADVLVHEATYTDEGLRKVGPAPQHSSAKIVAEFANEARINNLVLTHFSPRYQETASKGLLLSDLEAEARTAYRGTLFLAKDFDRYHLDRQGVLSKIAQN